MRRFSSVHMLAWVIGFLVFSLMPTAPSTLAQPAPCPEAYPYDESVGTCVDPETGLPIDPETGLPIDPGEEEEPVEEEPVEVVPEGDLASFAL
ncbi:MAG: hypothetical protein WKF81_02960 [Thermomicrobiales bacterium]